MARRVAVLGGQGAQDAGLGRVGEQLPRELGHARGGDQVGQEPGREELVLVPVVLPQLLVQVPLVPHLAVLLVVAVVEDLLAVHGIDVVPEEHRPELVRGAPSESGILFGVVQQRADQVVDVVKRHSERAQPIATQRRGTVRRIGQSCSLTGMLDLPVTARE